MVSWAGDGLISGYDPLTMRLVPDLYHLASPGTVDLNGITRLGYDMGAGLSAVTYPNRIDATAPLTITSTDLTNNPGKYLGAALYWVDAAFFPAGYIPKPSEIVALGDSKVNVEPADTYYSGGSGITHTFAMFTANTGWSANTKFWCAVIPTAVSNLSGPTDLTNYRPMAGVDPDVVGRCVSLWTTRTPAKPTITSPATGSVVVAGTTFTLAYNPNDPDEAAPSDTHRYNDDVAGVHIQYAPMPTANNPAPVWSDLQIAITAGSVTYIDDAWVIRGALGSGTNRLLYLPALIDNLGCVVRCGITDGSHVAGQAELPAGNWQLRVRTFDFGHPYPNDGTDNSKPGPLGINMATTMLVSQAKDTYPAVDTSPWSDPVQVTVPSQVPPPLVMSPRDDIAVAENSTVRLQWDYRNTHQPPRDQYRRTVQIRKVGDPDYVTVFDGYTAAEYVDLPPVLTQTGTPAVNQLTDGGFESGLNGWVGGTGTYTTTISRINNSANAHSGNYYLQAVSGSNGEAVIIQDSLAIDPAAQELAISFWAYKDISIGLGGVLQAWWKDSGGVDIIPSDPFHSPYIALFTIEGDSRPEGWNKFTTPTSILRPPGGVTLHVEIDLDPSPSGPVANTFRVDDITISTPSFDLGNFSMSALNEYEWRVMTIDTDAIVSNYSEPARFWVVPLPGSGAARPVSGNTIEGATLGCGTHKVEVYRRGGLERVGELRGIAHVDWERKRDDISTSQVVVSGWDVDCGKLLSKLQTWAYELVIWRDNGTSVDRVFEGPITLLTYEIDKVTIDAKDVMAYAYRRIIKQKMSDAGSGNGTTVVNRAQRVLQNVFAPDDPNILSYLQIIARDDDAMQYRSTPAYSRTAYEEIDDMASNAGLDYTVVGRSIMVWGTKHRIGTLPEFRDEDLGNSPIVSEYGMSFANRYAVSDGNGVWGEATRLTDGMDQTYGLVEMLSSTWAQDSQNETGTYTQEGLQTLIDSFTSFAERSIADRYPPPVVVRIPDNTTLNPGAVISIQHLVPGVVIPLRSTKTLRQVVASQKLDSVKVVEEGGKETVSITVSPFSRDDVSVVTGGE